ncbi:MAG: SIMPL domain-containing protein [Phycisphaeraceae bacterium]
MNKPFNLLIALAVLLVVALPSLAEQTITVSAVGEAKLKPDTLVLSGQISESNEKMKDAVTGFRDTRRRAMAAIKELGIENMSISTSALSMQIAGAAQGGGFGGEAQTPAAPGALMISQSVTLTVSGIDKLEEEALIDLVTKVMAGAKEAGVKSGVMDAQSMIMMQMGMGGASGGSAMFTVSDPDAAYKAATKDAVAKARADATYLAELAGGKLGRVMHISEGMAIPGDDESGMNPYMAMFGQMMGGEKSDPYAREDLDDITITRPLDVSFELITE